MNTEDTQNRFTVKGGARHLLAPGEPLPRAFRILKYGDNPSTHGTLKIGRITEGVLSGNQQRTGFDRVAIDFDHSTVPGSPAYEQLSKSGKPPIIFGYGTVRVDRDRGLYLDDVEWTATGEESARNFPDISGAVSWNGDKEITMVHSVALTTNGAVEDTGIMDNLILNSANLVSAIDSTKAPLRGRARMLAAQRDHDTRRETPPTALLGADLKISGKQGRARFEAAQERDNALAGVRLNSAGGDITDAQREIVRSHFRNWQLMMLNSPHCPTAAESASFRAAIQADLDALQNSAGAKALSAVPVPQTQGVGDPLATRKQITINAFQRWNATIMAYPNRRTPADYTGFYRQLAKDMIAAGVGNERDLELAQG